MTEDGSRRLTLHTHADDDLLRQITCTLAAKSGRPALLLQQEPADPERAESLLVEVRPQLLQPWTRRRWLAGLFVNTGVAVLFYLKPDISGITGYLIGFALTCLILMW